MKRYFLLVIALLLLVGLCGAEDWLTIYNDDLSMVRTRFELDLNAGRQSYNFDDITSRIEPASVIVSPLKEKLVIAEQNYEFDLAGTDQILLKYLDKDVIVVANDKSTYNGTLKFFDGISLGLVEANTGKLILISKNETQLIRLAEMPSNFYTKPTLHWSLIAPKKGKYPMQLTYLSGGFSWNVAYNAIWNEKTLVLNSWVTIDNRSGKAFKDVNLKLIAGDVNRVYNNEDMLYNRFKNSRAFEEMDAMAGGAAPSFEEKAFHDFHMYSLDQKVSFADKQKKQIQLFPTKEIKAKGSYEYSVFSEAIYSIISFENKSESGLGIPLPKGVIKVYKQDSDTNLEFIGEDSIKHTSRNEKVRISTGKAFDLVGRSITKDHKNISKTVSERTIEVRLRNNSTEKKTIVVIHQLYPYAKIISKDHKFKLDEQNRALFEQTVAPDAELVFSFVERTER